ncbi:MAG: RNA-binding S4 domain-containing protein [Mycobacteriaceae bacterium]
MQEKPTSARVDVWLWSVRLCKTRSAATTAIKAGHIRVNGERPKPAQAVKIDDEIRIRFGHIERLVIVKQILNKRVGAPVAVEAYIDNSPLTPSKEAFPHVAQRDRGTGRPTKKDRREIEKLLRRD